MDSPSIDNIIGAEVVLADGNIVTTSQKENPDLYWAMRGAKPCSGVATSIVFRGHPTGQIFHSGLVFPPSAIPTIVEFVNYMLKTSQGESSAIVFFGTNIGEPVSVFYNGPENEEPESGNKYHGNDHIRSNHNER